MDRVSKWNVLCTAVLGAVLSPLVMQSASAGDLKSAFKKVADGLQRTGTQAKQAPPSGGSATPVASAPQGASGSAGAGSSAHPDVVGITVGISDVTATRAAISKWGGDWSSIVDSKGYLADPTSDSGAAIPNTNYVAEVHNVGGGKGAFSVIFALPPSKPAALYVKRQWSYGDKESNTPEQFLSALKKKYGENAFLEYSLPGMSLRYVWAYAPDGSQVRLNAKHPCIHDPTWAAGGSGNDTQYIASHLKAGCVARVTAALEIGNGVVTNSTIFAADFANIVASEQATSRFVDEFVASKTKKKLENAGKHGGPAL